MKLPEWHKKLLTLTPLSGKEDDSVVDVTEYSQVQGGLSRPHIKLKALMRYVCSLELDAPP